MSIVSNSSALINLARIGKLDLLQQLYGELIVPDAVWKEVVVEGSGQCLVKHFIHRSVSDHRSPITDHW